MATTRAAPFFDSRSHPEQVFKLWMPTLKKFNRKIKVFTLFNLIFFLVAGLEIALFFTFFSYLSQSQVIAFILAFFFLTLFMYFMLRLYLLAKMPEELMKLCDEYLNRCKELLRYQEGIFDCHISLARLAQKFARALHEKEYTFYSPPAILKSLASLMEKFSAFCHWKDVHRLKELLLSAAVEEHLKVVKCEPTNLEVHAALANAYVMLSSLYADPRKYSGYDEEKWVSPERCSQEMQDKFRQTAKKAIEEFKILNDYAPDDPWVHLQLAYSYHDLQMPEDEIREYETILNLRPDDKDTLFKLGMLYFQQGMNAKGLRIYEKLLKTNYKKAESLIKFYGTCEEYAEI